MKIQVAITTKTLILIASIIALAACSSTVHKSDRDTSAKYDGRWNLQITPANTPQRVHNWNFTCHDYSTVSRSRLVVKDGQATLVWRGWTRKTYVNTKGVFKFEYPGGRLRVSNSSGISAVNPNIKIFIRGNLDEKKGKGTLVVGFAEVGYAGCTSKVSFERAK